MKKTKDTLKGTSITHCTKFYYVAQYGRRYISERARTNRYYYTFLPTSVRLLNAKSGRESGRGGWGDTMERTTIISIANTNVVVLCCVT